MMPRRYGAGREVKLNQADGMVSALKVTPDEEKGKKNDLSGRRAKGAASTEHHSWPVHMPNKISPSMSTPTQTAKQRQEKKNKKKNTRRQMNWSLHCKRLSGMDGYT